MYTSVFEQISSSLTVSSICSSIGPDIPAHADYEDTEAMFLESPWDQNLPSRVIDNDGTTLGIIWSDDWPDHSRPMEDWEGWNKGLDPQSVTACDLMQPLSPQEVLTSETTIFQAVQLFAAKETRLFYVLHINDVIGILRYGDLSKPLARLAFLSLALEIEDLALRLCQAFAEPCWLSLSEGRKRLAMELHGQRDENRRKTFRRKNDALPFGELISCTHLVDKAHMIWKQKLVPAATRKDVLGFFHELKNVRDICAHPGNERRFFQQLPRARLAQFIESAGGMRRSLIESMESHGVDPSKQPDPLFPHITLTE